MYSPSGPLSRPENAPFSRFCLTLGGNAAIILLIVQTQSEVNDINKQRFLPELGKLLTFMVEEDRQTALALYSRLFDDAADEQQLMDLLVSPTRQAVVIARTYDAKERRHQLESAQQGEPEETPAFVLTLDKLYQQVAPAEEDVYTAPEPVQEEPQVVSQFSLFPDDAHPIDDSEYVPFQIEAEAVQLESGAADLPLEEELPTPEEEPVFPEDAAPEEIEESPLPEEDVSSPEEELPEEPAPDLDPIVLPLPTRPVEAPRAEEPVIPDLRAPELDTLDLDYLPETRRKPRVFLLILFLLLAIPVTLVGVALLLIPTVLVLALAVLVIVMGSALLVTAFGGFPTLADILIVLGVSIVVLALGLLLLWLFVWFVGGAIGGMIGGMVNLCRKWCYEEVPV